MERQKEKGPEKTVKDRDLWRAVDKVFEDALAPEGKQIPDGSEHYAALNVPEMNVSPLQGKFLQLLVRMNKAFRVLEIGTFLGYSSIWMGQALPEGGILKTIDFKDNFIPLAEKNIAAAGLSDKIQILYGDAAEILQNMINADEEPFDFVFLDADKPRYADFLDLILQLSRSGTVIIADNVVWEGEIANPDTRANGIKGVRRYMQKLQDCGKIDSTALQMVGTKGHDGMIISYVK